MKIAFHGAARTVTGSKHLVTLDNGKKILLDCGLFQGMGKQTDSMNREWGFDPAEIDYLILSHAHIDHTGLVPKLVKDGYKGKIYCTPATKDLSVILLKDSAGIQEDDAKYNNKRLKAQGVPYLPPLYSCNDVDRVIPLFAEVDYGNWYRIDENIELLYTDAGHIIGSAAVNLRITENSKTNHITFSGDVGRYNDMILRDPQEFPQADYIILESTYGNKLHEADVSTPDLLLTWIEKTCIQKKGKLIIPAFSVGRTQELLFALNQLAYENRLPDLDYFVDSPMSIEVTEVLKLYPQYFNNKIQKLLLKDKDPFSFRGLTYVESVEQSKTLNFRNGPFVIISASGMAESGRVKHHISNNIENSRNTILMSGYAEPYSLAGRLMSGAKEVTIYGVDHEVHAEIGSIRSMSAHGDYKDLCQFVSSQDTSKIKKLFLVHGEYDVQQDFRQRLQSMGFQDVEIPGRHEEVIINY
jgi:metallo-beta-lactamase family protein